MGGGEHCEGRAGTVSWTCYSEYVQRGRKGGHDGSNPVRGGGTSLEMGRMDTLLSDRMCCRKRSFSDPRWKGRLRGVIEVGANAGF